MIFVTDTVTHLRHKWCVQFILPLAPRAKQPSVHIHTAKKHLIDCHKLKHTVHGAVELARFLLAAGGGERSGPNMLLWLLFSFKLGLRELGMKGVLCDV